MTQREEAYDWQMRLSEYRRAYSLLLQLSKNESLYGKKKKKKERKKKTTECKNINLLDLWSV